MPRERSRRRRLGELPSGTVTLLFTDIEGSTRLLRELGDEYGPLLRDHHRLLVSASAQHGGRLVDTQGDACFLVFETADSGVAAAAAAQRALAEHPWPGGATVRVRMGLHTGAPVPMDDRYVGMDVHRAARISAAAHGGQVLVSSVTRELVHTETFGWKDLGLHRLKDLERPEHVYQLQAPGLALDFPPPSALGPATPLPEPPTRFVGRRRDVRAVGRLLLARDTRVVTLLGPGGVGKTRLAVQVAHEHGERFGDGVVFVPVATVTEQDGMGPAIATALGVPDTSPDRLPAVLGDYLQSKHLLLILDNLEHLQESAPLVAALVGDALQLRVLVTSRSPLNLYGERVYPVAPLALPGGPADHRTASRSDAVALFVDRAKTTHPGFRLTSGNVRAVVEITRRVDGIPLAIELAAARAATLSPSELLERLELGLLGGGEADRPDRQRTLRDTIEWSHRLLGDEERTVFRRLSVFAGGAALSDVERVVDPDRAHDVVTGLTSLVRQSLVWRDELPDGTSRFRMLETIREFASEELARFDEVDAVANRHAQHFLAFVSEADEHLEGPESATWLARVERELPNLRMALRWALEDSVDQASTGLELVNALSWFWYTRGDAVEAIRWLEAALESAPTMDRSMRARLVYFLGAMLERLGLLREARVRFEEALTLFRELGDDMRVARTLNSVGAISGDLGETERAEEMLTQAEAMLAGLGDSYGRAVGLVNLSDVALARGALDRAEELARSGRVLFTELENPWGAAVALRHLAKAAYAKGDLSEARRLLLEALRDTSELGDRHAAVRCLERLAGVEVALGDPLRAARLAAAADALRREIGEPMAPDRRASFEQSWAVARASLGDEEYRRAWAQGGAMTLDQAVDYALSPRHDDSHE